MHLFSFPPICPYGSTEDEHLKFADPKDGSVFLIWALTHDHSTFLRVHTDADGFASYLIGPAVEVMQDCLELLPLTSPRQRRRVRRQLRRWGLRQRLFRTPNQSIT